MENEKELTKDTIGNSELSNKDTTSSWVFIESPRTVAYTQRKTCSSHDISWFSCGSVAGNLFLCHRSVQFCWSNPASFPCDVGDVVVHYEDHPSEGLR